MKRSLLVWGLLLTAGGFLLFRFGLTSVYPGAIEYIRAGNSRQFWDGLTAGQKISLSTMEVPFFAGLVLVFGGLVQLVTRKKSPN
jgi:hypothetical protein